MKDLTIAKFMDISSSSSSLFSRLSAEALYIGNVGSSDAKSPKELLLTFVASCKGIEKEKCPKQEVLIVTPPEGSVQTIIVPTINPKEPNTAIEIYIQYGKDNIKDRVLLDLLVQIFYDPLFDQLRTEE